ncbi:MAG: hypothetical protein HY431_02090, partial [Candidatus Levybacteria bacterium]|nr:hypothetical protein [Candidatus Levybacteria bacterium]
DRHANARDDKNFELPPYKVEVKNINSFRFVEKAIEFEIKRQTEILEKGQMPLQETRGYNENKNTTFSQRVKEEANDYRYFPEPDIPPVTIAKDHISSLKDSLPELREEKMKRFAQKYGLPQYDVEILTREKALSDFFEEAVVAGRDKNISPKQIANYIINKKITIAQISPTTLTTQIVSDNTMVSISGDELQKVIDQVLSENQKAVLDFKKGKESVIMFLVGQVMRSLGKMVDVQLVKNRLASSLKENHNRLM